MATPSGYIAVGVVGYTSKGDYDNYTTYNRYNTVTYKNSTWVCNQDGTTGIAPVEGNIWHLMAQGYVLTLDSVPTLNSFNPVESNGIYNALKDLNDNKQTKFRTVLLNQELSFSGTDAVVTNLNIKESTHAYVYYASDSLAEVKKAKIEVTTEDGLIRFRAKSAPSSTITCDIIFDS